MSKRGQIALFISIGIVILVGILFFYYAEQEKARFDTTEITEYVPIQLEPIKLYVDECLELAAASVTTILGSQGGFILPSDPYLETDSEFLAYGYLNGEDRLPSPALMQEELATNVVTQLQSCTNEFSAFNGIELEWEAPEARVTISEGRVQFVVDYPITLLSEQTDSTIRKFYYELPVRLHYIRGVAQQIVDDLEVDPEHIDLTKSAGYDVTVDYNAHDANNMIVSITDYKSMLNEVPFVFVFANSVEYNKPPQLDMQDEYVLQDNVQFDLQVGVIDDDDSWDFSDDTSMFEISDTGEISFTPRIAGEHIVHIRVEDPHGDYDEKTVRFVVE